MVATHFPIVFEPEGPRVISAYVAGLPVYAQGATQRQAERAIRSTLAAYLDAHPEAQPHGVIKVASVRARQHTNTRVIAIVSAAALVGRRTSARKAASSRANGQLGGRPRKHAAKRPTR